MNSKKIKFLSVLCIAVFFQSCVTKPPENPDNICLIFKEKRSWYKAVMRSEKRWKIPPYVLMSFVYQESSFKSDARPERDKLLGFIPWFRPSTAVGYSQALTMTWDDYKDETGNKLATRTRFKDSVDFIGWYTNKTNSILKISKNDVFKQYVAYHEGWGNYKNYKKNKKIIDLAKRVEKQSDLYKKQLLECQNQLNKNKYIIF